jgi:hypothetical protein
MTELQPQAYADAIDEIAYSVGRQMSHLERFKAQYADVDTSHPSVVEAIERLRSHVEATLATIPA